MADKLELLKEANRRGILPESQRALFTEAVNRGLITIDAPPIDFQSSHGQPQEPEGNWRQTVSTYAKPVLETAGMVAGGVIGGGAGAFGGPAAPATVPAGALAGGTIGYGIGRQAGKLLDNALGVTPVETPVEAVKGAASDLVTGANMEMTGQSIFPAAGLALKGAGNVGKEILGKMTGAGPEAIAQAVKGEKGFAAGMRGGEGMGEKVLADTRAALGQVKADRGVTYANQFAEVAKNKKPLDPTPFKSKIEQTLQKFNIRRVTDGAGETTLDFSRSSITDDAARNKAAKIIQDFDEWGSQADDFTPVGLDLLKRRIQDYYDPNAPAIANMSTDLSNFVKGNIVKEVPEYAKMVKGYEDSTRFINEAERALSLGNKAMMDTSIKKLLSTNRENFEFRRELLNQIEQRAGRSLSPEIAGLTMQQFTPKGLVGVLGTAGAGYAAGISPSVLAFAAMSSPRLAGEFLYTFAGVPRREAAKLLTSPEFVKYAGAVRLAAKTGTRGALVNTNQPEGATP